MRLAEDAVSAGSNGAPGVAAIEPVVAARERSRRLLVLGLILAVALGLRLYRIGDSGFWLDEFCSVECSTGVGLLHAGLPRNVVLTSPPLLTTLASARPWWTIWSSLNRDNHPPLYFILLRWWRDIFGESDAAARGMSVVPSLVGILLFYDAVRMGFSAKNRDSSEFSGARDELIQSRPGFSGAGFSSEAVALWAALLMAVAMPEIHYGQEARAYSLWTGFGMGACAAMVRIEKLGLTRRRIIGLIICVLGMMLSHYFAIVSAGILGVYAMIRLRGAVRAKTVLALIATAIFYAIIWGPFMWAQWQYVADNNAWQIEPGAGHLALTLSRAALLPARLLSESPAAFTPWAYAGAIVCFIALWLPRRRPELLLWYLWLVAPIALVVGLDIARDTKQTDLIRYTIIGGPGLYALIAGGILRRGAGPDQRAAASAPHRAAGKFPWSGHLPWLKHLLPAAGVLICVGSLRDAYSSDRNWPLVADFLKTNVQSGDIIVYASADRSDWYAGSIYLGVSHYAGELPAPIVLLTRPADGRLDEQINAHRTIWLVAGSGNVWANDLLPGTQVQQRGEIPDVGVVWELTPPVRGSK
jgi:hypothetical protein